LNKTIKRAIRVSRANSEWFCTSKHRPKEEPEEEILEEPKEDPQNKIENK